MNVLLLSPQTPTTFWSFKHALRFLSCRSIFPPLGLLTVAGMLPRDWNLKLIDLDVTRLSDDDIRWADYVMVGGMIVHKASAREIIARCQQLGRTIIAGGPLFTTGHEEFGAGLHYVLGEAENVIDDLIRDMERGQLQHTYRSPDSPDVTRTPPPRWDLVRMKDYATMSVQFSRGCPFNCEFCDIIVMNGRVPRTKTPGQMLAELDVLHANGWKDQVFIVDDNFIGNKVRVKEFLRELITWRKRTGSRMGFFTEASVNLADDPELLTLMCQAGFTRVFVGLETPVPASLRECQKHQNARRDLSESVRTIQRAGLEVMGGFIVGFDSDPQNIFDLQFEFIQRTGIVTAMVGLLTALPKTQLYERLFREGRLLSASTGNNTEASLNFVPKLNRDYLVGGYRQLMRALYEPDSYYQRILTFLAEHRPSGPKAPLLWSDFKAFLNSLWLMGVVDHDRWAYWRFFFTVLYRYPDRLATAMAKAISGHHFRLVADAL